MGAFLTVMKYVTLIPMLVQGVEGLFTKGSDKKAAVMNSADSILNALVSAGIVSAADAQKYPNAVSALVDAFVAFFNATGVFTSSTASSK